MTSSLGQESKVVMQDTAFEQILKRMESIYSDQREVSIKFRNATNRLIPAMPQKESDGMEKGIPDGAVGRIEYALDKMQQLNMDNFETICKLESIV